MRKSLIVAAVAAFWVSGSMSALAQTQTGMTHTEGMSHDMSAGLLPTEPGQGAFAAVSEIVAMLAADPNTDWNVVNIAALRDHLVDMDMLITHADVFASEIEDGLEMRISLAGPGGGAVSRMVPAHGPVLAAETGWENDVQIEGKEIVWKVTSARNAAQIRALGFFGLMTVGDHHTEHHLGMASGVMVHN